MSAMSAMKGNMARVVHIASGDAWGGAERVVEVLLRELMSSCDLTCILFNDGLLANSLRRAGVPVEIVPEANSTLYSLVNRLRAALSKLDPDIIHCHRDKDLMATVLARRFSTTKIFMTVHGLAPRREQQLMQFLRPWAVLIAARLVGVRTFAVSEELTRRLRRWPMSIRAEFIPNPMPIVARGEESPDLRALFGWSSQSPLVGFIGRLESVKGADLLLDVVERASPDIRWVIIGSGSMESELRRRCQDEGLNDRVGFLGLVPEAAPLVWQMDVLAMTSRHEGTPMALLEAAYCEVPVIGFGVGGIPALLEAAPKSWCIPPGSLDLFAKAVEDVSADRESACAAARVWSEALRARYGAVSVRDAYLKRYWDSLGLG